MSSVTVTEVLNIYQSFINFPLKHIKREDIPALHRKSKQNAYLLIKHYNVFVYAVVPKDFVIPSSLRDYISDHRCGKCSRLSSAPDNATNPGCAKTRVGSKHIEYYDFIEIGIETINIRHWQFLVTSCCNYSIEPVKSNNEENPDDSHEPKLIFISNRAPFVGEFI